MMTTWMTGSATLSSSDRTPRLAVAVTRTIFRPTRSERKPITGWEISPITCAPENTSAMFVSLNSSVSLR